MAGGDCTYTGGAGTKSPDFVSHAAAPAVDGQETPIPPSPASIRQKHRAGGKPPAVVTHPQPIRVEEEKEEEDGTHAAVAHSITCKAGEGYSCPHGEGESCEEEDPPGGRRKRKENRKRPKEKKKRGARKRERERGGRGRLKKARKKQERRERRREKDAEETQKKHGNRKQKQNYYQDSCRSGKGHRSWRGRQEQEEGRTPSTRKSFKRDLGLTTMEVQPEPVGTVGTAEQGEGRKEGEGRGEVLGACPADERKRRRKEAWLAKHAAAAEKSQKERLWH